MIGIIVKPMERGQITLPKEYRDKLSITPDTMLNLTLDNDRIIVKTLFAVLSEVTNKVIKPKISRKEFLTALSTMKGAVWTKEDDEALKRMEAKEKRW
jgi:AbrB family looped-hinge helix DNA binding protein